MSILNNVTSSDIIHNVLANSSRYINLDLVQYDDKTMLNVPNKINITPSVSNPDNTVVITGRLVDRLDLVSLQYYGTPKYWWILANYNGFENPFLLPYGTVIKVPTFTTLLMNDLVRS